MLALTQDGYPVYDRHNSHLHKEVVPFLEAALARIHTDDRAYIREDVLFDQPIGVSHRVTTCDKDEIVFAQRINRVGLTRFVKHRQPDPSSTMVVVLKRSDCGKYYVLITAYVGNQGLAEPWDWERHFRSSEPLQSYAASVDYWNSHALVWDPQEIVPGSETLHPWH